MKKHRNHFILALPLISWVEIKTGKKKTNAVAHLQIQKMLTDNIRFMLLNLILHKMRIVNYTFQLNSCFMINEKC